MALTREQYIDRYKDLAVEAVRDTGLFASVMLAQAIVESNNGNSSLASKYNNHFGIKADNSWTGEKVNLQTREVIQGKDVFIGDWFRVYKNPVNSYIDRVKFLQQNPRYANAGVFTAQTPKEQLEALQRAGYATDPKYAEVLNSVIERNNLTILDRIKEAVKETTAAVQKQVKDKPAIVIGIVTLFIVLLFLLFNRK